MANTKLIRTPSSASNRKTFTISFWFKIGVHPFTESGGGDSRELIGQTSSGYFRFMIKPDETIRFYSQSGINLITNRKFRDKSAFYHAVLRLDMTQGTRENRVRLYINGVDERTVGGYATDNIPGQNTDLEWNISAVHQIGGHSNNYDYFSGVMSHIHHCDGGSLAPTVFGSTDSTTGEWQINTSPSFTPGTNGFTILKDGNTITDQSANSNNFSLQSGAVTNTKDCPSNVFATVNPLWFNSSTLTNGNLTVAGGSAHRPNIPTLAASSGKYYFEAKMISGNSNKWWLGYADQEYLDTRQYLTSNIDLGGGNISGGVNQKNGAVTAGWGNQLQQSPISAITNFFSSAGAANDIMAMAIDLDNQKIWWSLNGTWRNGSASASTTFNASYPDSTNLDAGRNYYLCCGSENSKWSVNYGNGFFGTTAITTNSGNGYAGAEGASKFNYAVPSGFSAISTKGLNN